MSPPPLTVSSTSHCILHLSLSPLPLIISSSAKDCFDQLDFQIKLLGNSDASYTPCVGLICAPYMVGWPPD